MLGLGLRGVRQHIVDRLLPRPTEHVQARIDHETGRTQRVLRQPAQLVEVG